MNNRPPGNGRSFRWLSGHISFTSDECLHWPFSRDLRGYGTLGYYGRTHRAHRLMCELANGPPPTPKHLAAHSCHNRICVNPKHLSWQTNSQNQLSRRENGTSKTARFGRGGHVLTPEQRTRVRELDGSMTRAALAEQFGVSRRTIERTCKSA